MCGSGSIREAVCSSGRLHRRQRRIRLSANVVTKRFQFGGIKVFESRHAAIRKRALSHDLLEC
jgi:hypothetical protein